MQGGNANATSVQSWQVRGEGSAASALLCHCRRMCWDEAHGRYQTAARTGTSKAERTGIMREVLTGSALGRWPNNALQRTRPLLRFRMNMSSLVLGPAAEGRR